MSNISYGVLDRNGGFIATSTTEKGAKRKATNNGYSEVYAMHNVSWAVWKIAEKINGKWVNV